MSPSSKIKVKKKKNNEYSDDDLESVSSSTHKHHHHHKSKKHKKHKKEKKSDTGADSSDHEGRHQILVDLDDDHHDHSQDHDDLDRSQRSGSSTEKKKKKKKHKRHDSPESHHHDKERKRSKSPKPTRLTTTTSGLSTGTESTTEDSTMSVSSRFSTLTSISSLTQNSSKSSFQTSLRSLESGKSATKKEKTSQPKGAITEEDDETSDRAPQPGLKGSNDRLSTPGRGLSTNSEEVAAVAVAVAEREARNKMLELCTDKLHGREQETRILCRVLDHAFREGEVANVVFVLGTRGTGKSRFVDRTLQDYSSSNTFVLRGKFDPNHTNISRPYAAFLEVFTDLANQIMKHPDAEMFKANIRAAVGSEGYRITSLLPSFSKFIMDDDEDGEHCEQNLSDRSTLHQTFRLLREVLREICTPTYPVIMYIDDLHLGGTESMELFQFLSKDAGMGNFVLIGTLENKNQKPKGISFPTMIELFNLNEISTNSWVANILKEKLENTQQLSRILWRKTSGNCEFLEQLIYRLEQGKIFKFDANKKCWAWNQEAVETELLQYSTITDVMEKRIAKLPAAARVVLMNAAIIGNKFHSKYLEAALSADPDIDIEGLVLADEESRDNYPAYKAAIEVVTGEEKFTTNVQAMVEALTRMSFFIPVKASYLRFAHDAIHSIGLELVGDRTSAHWRMGYLLQNIMDQQEGGGDRWLFFAVVEQLNMGSDCIVETEERLEIAALTLRAAYAVKKESAFYPAGDYAREGLELLRNIDHKWDFYNNLLTKLMLIRAEMAMCCGVNRECMVVTSEIIENARSLHEIVPAYILRIRAFGQAAKFTEAVWVGVEVLEKLGEKFPVDPHLSAITPILLRGRRRGFGKKEEDFDELGLMEDEQKKKVMEILAIIVFYAVRGNERTQKLVPFFFNRMYELTVDRGYCFESVVAFAGYGVLMAGILKDFDEGHRYGQLAMILQSGLGHQYQARGSHMVYAYLHHLKEPLADSLPALTGGFKAGMAADETADAMNCLGVWCSHYLNSGMPLHPFLEEMQHNLNTMVELERSRVWEMTVPYVQLAENLAGKTNNPSVLSGSFFNWVPLLDRIEKADNLNAVRAMYAASLEAAYWFGEYDRAQQMMDKLTGLEIGIGQALTFNYRREVFFMGLTCLGLTKQGRGTMKITWKAKQCLGALKGFLNQGSPDCKDLVLILEAECNAYAHIFVGKGKTAESYEHAIDVATQLGSMQNMSLTKELAGFFYMENGEKERGRVILKQAYESYLQWNANGKAQQLAVMYPGLAD